MSTHFFVAGRADSSNNPTELPIGLRYSNTIYYDNSSNIYVNDVNCNSLNYITLDPPIPAGAPGAQGAQGPQGADGAQGANGGGSVSIAFLSKVTQTENVNFNEANAVKIQWDNQDDIDSNNFTHSTTNQPSIITVNSSGVYFIDSNISFINTGNNRVTIAAAIWLKTTGMVGSEKIGKTTTFSYSRGANYGDESIQLTTQLSLNAGDEIEIRAWADYADQTNAVNTISELAEFKISRISQTDNSSEFNKVSIPFFTDLGGTAYGSQAVAMVPAFDVSGRIGWPVLPHGAGAYYNIFGKGIKGSPTEGSPWSYGEVVAYDGRMIGMQFCHDFTATTENYRVRSINYSQGASSDFTRIQAGNTGTISNIFTNSISFSRNDIIGILIEKADTTEPGATLPPGTDNSAMILQGSLIIEI